MKGFSFFAVLLAVLFAHEVFSACSPACQVGYSCDPGDTCVLSSPDCSNQGHLYGASCMCFSGHLLSDCSFTATHSCPSSANLTASNLGFQISDVAGGDNYWYLNFKYRHQNGRYVSNFQLGSNPNCDITILSNASISLASSAFDDEACTQEHMFTLNGNRMLNACGISLTDNPNEYIYSGSLDITVTEIAGVISGETIYRQVSNHATFNHVIPKTLTLYTSNVVVVSSASVEAVILNQMYYYVNDTALITIKTYTPWPYQLKLPLVENNTIPYEEQITFSYISYPISCSGTTESDVCTQAIVLNLTSIRDTLCTFDGSYEIFTTTTCRSGVASSNCPDPEQDLTISFALLTGNICGQYNFSDPLTGSLDTVAALDDSAGYKTVFAADQPVFLMAEFTTYATVEDITLTSLKLILPSGDVQLVSSSVVNPTYQSVIDYQTLVTFSRGNIHLASFIATYGNDASDIFQASAGTTSFTFDIEAEYLIEYEFFNGGGNLKKRSTHTSSTSLTMKTTATFTPKALEPTTLSPGALAGVVLGCFFGGIVVLGGFFLMGPCRLRKKCHYTVVHRT